MTSYVLLKDEFGDVHAAEIQGEATGRNIDDTAQEFMADHGIDGPCHMALCHATDAGAARLKWDADGTHQIGATPPSMQGGDR